MSKFYCPKCNQFFTSTDINPDTYCKWCKDDYNEIDTLQSENAELKKLVRELVECCEWAANTGKECYQTKCTCVENHSQITLSRNKELITKLTNQGVE